MFADLVDLVWPRYCLGCGISGSSGGSSGSGVCADCSDVRPAVRFVPGLGPVHAAASYGGAVRAAIIHYKDRRRLDLRAQLTEWLDAAVCAARADMDVGAGGAGVGGVGGVGVGGARADLARGRPGGLIRSDRLAHIAAAAPVLVPVPSTARAARERGGDHMRRLATSVARRQRLRADGLLQVGRPIQDAAGLGAAARAANLAGAYVCRGVAPARAGPVILVDDVITTGASLREATRALTAAGYRVQGFAVIAIVPAERRSGAGRRDATR